MNDQEIREALLRHEDKIQETTDFSYSNFVTDDDDENFKFGDYISNFLSNYSLVWYLGDWWVYIDGVYHKVDEKVLEAVHEQRLGCVSSRLMGQIHSRMQRRVPLAMDAEDKYINLKNGILDTEDMTVIDHDPEIRMAAQLNVEYDPDEDYKCPRFMEYLDTVLPNKDLQEDLQMAMGSCLYRYIERKQILFIYGETDTGKSVIIVLLEGILGKDNISKVPITDFDDNGSVASMAGKTANIVNELPRSQKLTNVDRIKTVSAGETLEIRLPYDRSTTSFTPYATQMFATNELPLPDGLDTAMYNRFHFIPFLHRIPENEQNKQLAEELLAEEKQGIFDFMVEGLKRYIKREGVMTVDQEPEHQRLLMMPDHDSVDAFEDYAISHQKGSHAKLATVYQKYCEFCDAFDFEALDINGFYGAFKQKFPRYTIVTDDGRASWEQRTQFREVDPFFTVPDWLK